MPLEPGLYVAATPIGNLKDITLRAIETLQGADLILCEDTRQTGKLCDAHGIRTPRQPYHDHNGAKVRPGIIEKLREGSSICLVSDAGTPLISDPGYKLVQAARENGIYVTALPGPCAAITALSIAGLPSDQFFFAGFAPAKTAARDKFFKSISLIPATLIFYESASRVESCLEDMATIFGDRPVCIARELTKKFEETVQGQLGELAPLLEQLTFKGEIVILVGAAGDIVLTQADIDTALRQALKDGSVKQAATIVCEQLSIPRRDAYNRALILKQSASTQEE